MSIDDSCWPIQLDKPGIIILKIDQRRNEHATRLGDFVGCQRFGAIAAYDGSGKSSPSQTPKNDVSHENSFVHVENFRFHNSFNPSPQLVDVQRFLRIGVTSVQRRQPSVSEPKSLRLRSDVWLGKSAASYRDRSTFGALIFALFRPAAKHLRSTTYSSPLGEFQAYTSSSCVRGRSSGPKRRNCNG